ncbi:MAG: cysteine-rich small domain-containing protein [Blautia sp.]|nr:cysteine-rich small domain-containing protein [Blautia sp.]
MHPEKDKRRGNYSYFSHKDCEYFPCHENADRENFNCLFCYCPLYILGDECGGNFRYNAKGYKDCTNCLLPHRKEGYDYIIGKYPEIAVLMERIKEEKKRG